AVRGLDLCSGTDPNPQYDRRIGDIQDPSVVLPAVKGVDAVVHLAAEHKDSGILPDAYFRVNVDGTRTLLDSMTKASVPKIIFFSSVAVYGEADFPSEETSPEPVNAYGRSKLEAERLIGQWALADPSRQALIIRPTVVFGPRNRANIFKLIKYVSDGKFVW